MVYTVTFNPAVDLVIRTGKVLPGEVNRAKSEEIFFGGKGINVSVMLHRLSVKTKALGFSAGFTGKAIKDGVEKEGVETDFIELKKGFSRINIKIKSDNETELNGNGPEITDADIDCLIRKTEILGKGDVLVLAGSVPEGLSDDVYGKILETLSGKDVLCVVDARSGLLEKTLKYKPFLIKPNKTELSELVGRELQGESEIIKGARSLQEKGARNVLVSMAGEGALLADENRRVLKIGAPAGKAVNSVGAGDSMVAGFIAGYLSTGDYSYALRLGTAAGSATAFSSGLGERELIYELLDRI